MGNDVSNQDKGSATYVFLVCAVAALGGLPFGYDTAAVSGAITPSQTRSEPDANGTRALIGAGDVPEHVKVMPVFFVPKNETEPSQGQMAKLMRHLRLSQRVFKRMLKDRDTFEIEQGTPIIVHARHSVPHYKWENKPTTMTYELLTEIFEANGWNRFNCPYVLVIVVMNPKENVPMGAGRPFNRGFNSGGGLVYMSSYSLDRYSNFQGTLLHELGHSFGLPHVSAYGYDMEENRSIMSSNNNNYWNGFKSPRPLCVLIPEDLRALAKNKKVLPNFYFDPRADVPSGYRLCKTTPRLAFTPSFPGQKDYKIEVETDSGQADGSLVSNIVHNLIVSKASSFNAKRMWLSEITETGWVNAMLTFPVPVSLCKIAVHS